MTEPTYEYVRGSGWVPTLEKLYQVQLGWIDAVKERTYNAINALISDRIWGNEHPKFATFALLFTPNIPDWNEELIRQIHRRGWCQIGTCPECDRDFGRHYARLKERFELNSDVMDRVEACVTFWNC